MTLSSLALSVDRSPPQAVAGRQNPKFNAHKAPKGAFVCQVFAYGGRVGQAQAWPSSLNSDSDPSASAAYFAAAIHERHGAGK